MPSQRLCFFPQRVRALDLSLAGTAQCPAQELSSDGGDFNCTRPPACQCLSWTLLRRGGSGLLHAREGARCDGGSPRPAAYISG